MKRITILMCLFISATGFSQDFLEDFEGTPTISVNKAIAAGFKPEKNDSLVAKRPIDMPNEGFLPSNKRR